MITSSAAITFSLSLLAPLPIDPGPPAPDSFTTEQLEQLVAPIALYPDDLLAQILMSATYPLDVVEAARWVDENPDLEADALESALRQQPWDPSVKSLCGLPEVLGLMSEELTWTQDLGDAFLGQEADLMDAVQGMRHRAQDAGNLETTEEQVVTEEDDDTIGVESADDEVIYVPTYYSTVVYGGWRYRHWYYPRFYRTPPTAEHHHVRFSASVSWGSARWGTCRWHRRNSSVFVNVKPYNAFVDRTGANPREERISAHTGTRKRWKHEPEHRRGVAYRDPSVARQYGGSTERARVSNDRARGHGERASGRQDARTARHDERGERRSDRAYGGARDPELDSAGSTRGASSRNRAGSRPRRRGRR